MFPVVRVDFSMMYLGSLSGSLFWGALLLLTIFCLYQYVQNRTFCHNETDTVATGML